MTSFDESKIARAADGTFAPNQSSEADTGVLGTDRATLESLEDLGVETLEFTDDDTAVRVGHGTDAFAAIDHDTYPGYLNDREDLVNAYAQSVWGATLEGADWDDEYPTFEVPIEGTDTESVTCALREHEGMRRYAAEATADDETALSGLRTYLDDADHHAAAMTAAAADAGAAQNPNWDHPAMVARFRREQAVTTRLHGPDEIDRVDPGMFVAKVTSEQDGSAYRNQVAMRASLDAQARGIVGRADIDAVIEDAYAYDDLDQEWYRRVSDTELTDIIARHAQP